MVNRREKITVGIAHDYISFKELREDGTTNQVQLPIIYANELLRIMKKSNYCNEANVKQHSYQADYSLSVTIWCHDLGSWDLTPVTQTQKVITEIKIDEVKDT